MIEHISFSYRYSTEGSLLVTLPAALHPSSHHALYTARIIHSLLSYSMLCSMTTLVMLTLAMLYDTGLSLQCRLCYSIMLMQMYTAKYMLQWPGCTVEYAMIDYVLNTGIEHSSLYVHPAVSSRTCMVMTLPYVSVLLWREHAWPCAVYTVYDKGLPTNRLCLAQYTSVCISVSCSSMPQGTSVYDRYDWIEHSSLSKLPWSLRGYCLCADYANMAITAVHAHPWLVRAIWAIHANTGYVGDYAYGPCYIINTINMAIWANLG